MKNEATDLLENKGSASAEMRNEATVESVRQSPESDPEAAERRNNVAQGESPGVDSHHPLSSFLQTSANGNRQEQRMAHGKGEDGIDAAKTFDVGPSTLDFSKNEATDLIDNKRSDLGEIRNEATVLRQKAVGPKARKANGK